MTGGRESVALALGVAGDEPVAVLGASVRPTDDPVIGVADLRHAAS
jgi:hypothetical protein